MPTHTPSPHRFLAPPPPSAQKKTKPQSGLRNSFTAQTPEPADTSKDKPGLQFKKLTPAKRFVVGPHPRTLGTEENSKDKNKDESWTQPTPKPKPPRQFEPIESIEEPQSSPSTQFEDDNSNVITHPIEHNTTTNSPQDAQDQDETELLFTIESNAKRRRISSSPPTITTTQTSTPTTPTTTTTHTHRFLIPPPRPPLPFPPPSLPNPLTTPAITTTPSRPPFILPHAPTSPQKPPNPLPEIFSPSRKHAKYIPEGLAATMQSFIIDIANTGIARDGASGPRDKDGGTKMRLRISSLRGNSDGSEVEEAQCFSTSFTFIHGIALLEPSASRGRDAEVRVLLAGQGGARVAGGVKVRVGSVLGLRAPVWDVYISGEVWIVSVDWAVV